MTDIISICRSFVWAALVVDGTDAWTLPLEVPSVPRLVLTLAMRRAD